MIEASDRRFQELLGEFDNLQTLRKTLGLTQENIGEKMGKKQVSVAQLEKRSDFLLSTLRQYVEALGGELELVVKFKDKRPARLAGFGSGVVAETPRRKTTKSRRIAKAA
ncbi:helix-turn-helix domain-containing protein [Rhizobium sullae]|nr:XRE family transcriptional regulator [Rhizobium sullae]